MKHYIAFSIALIFLCSNINAQERFNNVYYDPDANLSNTVLVVDDDFVILTATTVNGGRGVGFLKFGGSGNLLFEKSFKFNDYNTYDGKSNSFEFDSESTEFYYCGTVEDEMYNSFPYIVFCDNSFDTTRTFVFAIDSVYSANDIVKINDSIYALTGQNLVGTDSELGLLLFNINTQNVFKTGFGNDDIISNEAGSVIIKTYENKLLLGGFTFGFSTSTYKQDWYLVNSDCVGNLIWERHYGNPNENDGGITSMLESKDSAYIVAGGQAICNWSMNPISEAALRKIDTAGNLIWEKFYRRYDFQNSQSLMRYSNIYIGDIVELHDGNFIAITSYARADGGTLLLLLKLTANGEVLWSKHLHTTDALGSNYCSSIKATDDGGYIINGYGSFSTTFDPPQQFFLIKTDSLGCEGELYPAPPVENVECPDFPDTMYCDGTYNSRLRVQGKSAPYTLEFSTGEVIENLYYPPVFIPKSQGTGSFTVHVGVDTYNHSYDTATLYNPIPAEDMEPDIIELPFTLTIPENYYGPDLTVTITNGFGESYEITLPIYVDCNVSTEQITENANISIYPNPASDFLQISLPESEKNTFVKIINAQGQVVLVEQLFNAETELNISELAAGSYVVRVYCGNIIENLRFEKM